MKNNEFYNKNMNILRKRYPELWHTLTSNTQKKHGLQVFTTEEGLPILEVKKNGKRFLLHSKRAPVKESERFANFLKIKEGQILILVGFGLGYHVETILNKNRNITLMVIEPDLDILHSALGLRDLSSLLMEDRLLIFSRSEDCFKFLSLEHSINISLIFYPPYLRFLNEKAKQIREEFTSFANKKSINRATIKKFDRLWTKNTFKNAYYFFSLAGINVLKQRLKGMPACVVCAGPSLENDLPHLYKIKNKIFIIAVDTAVKPLIKRGIQPDFIVTVDPQFINSLWMSGCIFNNKKNERLPVLVSDPAVYSTILKNYPGPKVICSSYFSPGKLMEKFSEKKGHIAAGGSVAVSAYDFTRTLGADPIILLGLDLCYSGGKTHLSGSFVQDYIHLKQKRIDPLLNFFHRYIKSGSPVIMPDKNGNIVYSDRRLLMYRGWFETSTLKENTINGGSGGLDIPGIKNLSMDKITATLSSTGKKKTNQTFNKIKIMNSIKNSLALSINKKGAINFLDYLACVKRNLEQLQSLSSNAKKMIKKYKDTPGLKNRLFKDLDRIDSQILLNTQENQLLSMVLQSPISSIMEGSVNEGGEGALKDSLLLYSSIEEGVQYLLKLIEITCKRLSPLKITTIPC